MKSKASEERRLRAAGWTMALGRNWDIWTSPCGFVQLCDRRAGGKHRYLVQYQDGGPWLESHSSGSFADAARVAEADAAILAKG